MRIPASSRNSVATSNTMYRAPLETGSPCVSCQHWWLELLLAVPPTSLSPHPILFVTWRFLVDRSSCFLQRCLDGVTSRPPRDPVPSRELHGFGRRRGGKNVEHAQKMLNTPKKYHTQQPQNRGTHPTTSKNTFDQTWPKHQNTNSGQMRSTGQMRS